MDGFAGARKEWRGGREWWPRCQAGNLSMRWRLAFGLLALLLSADQVAAIDFHVCDCGQGSAASCVVGNDTNSGASANAPWRSYERARSAFAGLAAGDSIRFCRGGVFTIGASARWVNDSCRADAPCTLGAYLPPGGAASLPPPLIQQTQGAGFGFDNTGFARQQEGYVVEDIDLQCSACASDDAGVFLFNDVDDVRLQRLRISGFGLGVYVTYANCMAGDPACCSLADPQCDGLSSRFALLDSEIRDSRAQGFLGGGDDVLIAGNLFERNGSRAVLDHNIYLVGVYARGRVQHNVLRRSAALETGRCRGTSLVAHGTLTDLVIEGNLIEEAIGLADPSCWGIEITPGNPNPERFLRATVRGNRVFNVGTAGIALASCVDCVVENNLIVHQQPHAIIGIRAPSTAGGVGDGAMDALTVRNNSIFVSTTNSVGIDVGGQGSGHRLVSNAIQSVASTGFWACLSLTLPSSAYAAINHNVCGFVAGAQREWELGSGSLSQWQVSSGFDAASLQQSPGFVDPAFPGLDLRATDAQAAMVGRGHPSLSAPFDIDGVSRGPLPDAGAHQLTRGAEVFGDGFE